MALQSAGTTNYLSFGNNAPFGATSPWSAVCTCYVDTSANDLALFGKRSGFSAGTNLFNVALGGTRRPAITKNGSFHVWNAPQVNTGQWFTMVVVGASGGAKSWVDGTQASGALATNLASSSDWRSGSATSANLEVFTTQSGDATFTGRIARVILYDRALSDDEAISASNGLRPPFHGRVFHCDCTRDARDLRNGWTATTSGSLTVVNSPRLYGIY